MIPVAVENKIKAMINGNVTYTSQNLGFNLLMSRLTRKYKSDPNPLVMAACMGEVKEFFEKYSVLMQREYDAMTHA